MQSSPSFLRSRLIQSTCASIESAFVHRRKYGQSTSGALPRHGSDGESHEMAAGASGGRRNLVEPQEIADPAG